MKFIWGEDCLEFRPERWLSSDGKIIEITESFKVVSFNAGPRICLGKDLAYLQMKSIAAAVLLRHRVNVTKGHKVEQKTSLTLFLKNGLVMDVHSRDLSPIVAKINQDTAEWVVRCSNYWAMRIVNIWCPHLEQKKSIECWLLHMVYLWTQIKGHLLTLILLKFWKYMPRQV